MNNESELPSRDTRPAAPGSLAEYGHDTVPPMSGGQSPPPFSTNSYQSVRSKDVSTTAATNPPMGSATDARTRPPMPIRRGLGAGLLVRLFALSTKLVPIAGVLVGGYYSYTYFFGPVPVVDRGFSRKCWSGVHRYVARQLRRVTANRHRGRGTSTGPGGRDSRSASHV